MRYTDPCGCTDEVTCSEHVDDPMIPFFLEEDDCND